MSIVETKKANTGIKVGELNVIASGKGKYVQSDYFTQPCDCDIPEPYLPSGDIEAPMQPYGTCIKCMREVINEQ